MAKEVKKAPAAAKAPVAKEEAKKVEVKAEVKAEAKKVEEKKAPAAKKAPVAKKAPAAKKPAAKKAPAAKKVAPATVKTVEIQVAGQAISYDALVKNVVKASKGAKSVNAYVNVEEKKVYIVSDKGETTSIDLF